MTYTLHYYELWPSSMAARVALGEQGAQATLARVDMSKGENRTPAFLALNPQGEPPVLVDPNGPLDDPSHGPLVVWEALAVSHYIQDKAVRANANPVLYPSDPCGYPETVQWASWTMRNLAPPVEQILLQTRILPPAQRNASTLALAVAAMAKSLQVLEQQVPNVGAGEQFMVREAHRNPTGTFSFADVVICSCLTYAHLFKAQSALQSYPKSLAYLATIEARPVFSAVFRSVTL